MKIHYYLLNNPITPDPDNITGNVAKQATCSDIKLQDLGVNVMSRNWPFESLNVNGSDGHSQSPLKTECL
ncbi:MAG: hypothetical protein LBG28_05750 [Tannerella sp.]|jgi:hypothetical protein|nr:hypothetical protein [Tannerella sp.]